MFYDTTYFFENASPARTGFLVFSLTPGGPCGPPGRNEGGALLLTARLRLIAL